jgi:LacI family transcriptional regulator
VAAAAGVSVTTVSRVLNDREDVAPETSARVRQVIAELGYASSLAARGMRSRRTQVIGVVLPDMDHSFAVELIKGVSRAITGTEYDLIALTSGRKSHEERSVWEQQQVARLNGGITDGIIVVAPDAAEFRTEYPVVAVDPYWHTTAYPAVIGANHAGTLEAMRYLLGLGHRRIGFVGGLPFRQSAERRQEGYEDALRAAGIPLDPELVTEGGFLRTGGHAAALCLLRLAEPPTAIFAANDDSAFGVIDAAHQLGVRVPEDLSVVGFDNVPDAAICRPPLTTVDQELAHMGQVAVRMVIDLIEGRPLAASLERVPTRLVVRSSCAAPAPERDRSRMAIGRAA